MPLSLHPNPYLSCSTNVFLGLKPQSAGAFGIGKPNVNVDFNSFLHKSLSIRVSSTNRTRARLSLSMSIDAPRVPYQTSGGTWKWDSLQSAFYKERVIFIGRYIDSKFSSQVMATMLYLDSIESSKQMHLYIHGPGGDLRPSMAIYGLMENLKCPVATHGVGYAYNLAGFLLAGGEKGMRVAMPLTRVVFQSPGGFTRGQVDDVHNEANELLLLRDDLFRELAKKTGQPVEKIYEDMSRMKSFSAQEALEYGIIDRILIPAKNKDNAPPQEVAGSGLG